MSKRSADEQITDKSSMEMNNGFGTNTWGAGGSQRATAAQLASRRLAKPKGSRRPPGASPRPAQSFSSLQQAPAAFGQSDLGQNGGFSFGQQQNSGVTQSFPQFGANSNSQNTGAAPPNPFQSDSFSFNSVAASTPANPFASSTNNAVNQQNEGFQGSMFSFGQSQTPAPAGQASPFSFGGNPTAPATTATPTAFSGFQFGAQTASPTTNTAHVGPGGLFSQTPQVAPQHNGFDFGQASAQKNEPSKSIGFSFGQTANPSPQKQTASSTNLFSGLTNGQQTPASGFAQSTPADASKPTNLFGVKPVSEGLKENSLLAKANSFQSPFPQHNSASESTTAGPGTSNQTAASPFFQAPAITNSSFPKSPERISLLADNMQTSPDVTPSKAKPKGQSVTGFSTPAPLFGAATNTSSIFSANNPATSVPPTNQSSPFKFQTTNANSPANPPTPKSPTKPESAARGAFASLKMPQTSIVASAPQPIEKMAKPQVENKPTFGQAQEASRQVLSIPPSAVSKASIGEGIPQIPGHFTTEERRHCVIAWRLRQLDTGLRVYLSNLPPSTDTSLLREFYTRKWKAIVASGDESLKSVFEATADTESSRQSSKQGQTIFAESINSNSLSANPPSSVKRRRPEDADDVFAATKRSKGADGEKGTKLQSESFSTITNADSNTENKSQTSNLFSSILSKGRSTPLESTKDTDVFAGFNASRTSTEIAPQGPSTIGALPNSIFSGANHAKAMPETVSTDLFSSAAPKSSFGLSTTESGMASSSAIKPPNFGSAAPTNFMAQFGVAARKTAESEKQKRKDEDFDSEEDDEAEWEKKYEKEQEEKRQKLSEESKSAPLFRPSISSKPSSSGGSTPKSIFDPSNTETSTASAPTTNLFGHLIKPNAEAASQDDDGNKSDEEHAPRSSGTSLFDRVSASQTPPTTDHTWKVDSPIKFGASTTVLPAAEVAKAASTPQASFSGLFGISKPVGLSSSTSGGTNLFANLQQPGAKGSVNFGFKPATPSTTSIFGNNISASAVDSRASTPGLTGTGDSAADSAAEQDEDQKKDSQIDLASSRAGEEDEDALFEIRSRASSWSASEKAFVFKGLGKLRVLKHKSTGTTRLVLRADPSGKVIINSPILSSGKIEAVGNVVRALLSDPSGKLSPHTLKVKTAADAVALMEKLKEAQV